MNPITTKLLYIPIAIASLIMAYSCSTTSETQTIAVAPVQEVALDPYVTTTTTIPPVTTSPLTPEQKIELERAKWGQCGEWHDLAMSVGWPSEEWDTLSYVIHRESRCNIGSHNKTDPNSGSRGLMQINGFWCRKSQWTQAGWLQDRGILSNCDDLFNPEVNLKAGLAIWFYGEQKHGCGWRGPWATKCS